MGTAGRGSKHLVQFPKIPVGERTCCDTKMILKKSKNQMKLQSALHAGMEFHLCRLERFSPNRFNSHSSLFTEYRSNQIQKEALKVQPPLDYYIIHNSFNS
jgi:hypothetical protein